MVSRRWLACAALVACASPAFDGRVYRDAQVAFRVAAVPQPWRAIEADGARLAFRDEGAGATILIAARCGVPSDDAPLAALTGQLVMGTTDRAFELEENLPFDGREARHTRMTAKLDGVPMAYDLYVFKKDGCVYDLALVAPPDRVSSARDRFEAFATGFAALPRDER